MTVESIVDATARILVKDGYEGLSTNRVAELAGVSIGSLYQYFPSKESLVLAVAERHCDKMMATFEGAIESMADAAIPDVVRSLIRLFMEAHAVEPKLHRALMEQVPLANRPRVLQDFERNVAAVVRGYIEVRASEIRPTDLDMATFILVHAVEGLAHGALLERPEYLKSERYLDEVTELVVRYLEPKLPSKKKAKA